MSLLCEFESALVPGRNDASEVRVLPVVKLKPFARQPCESIGHIREDTRLESSIIPQREIEELFKAVPINYRSEVGDLPSIP